jgi:catalase (peroxidase I)
LEADLSIQMALIQDKEFRPWVEKYAADQGLFFKDFAMAFGKLIGTTIVCSACTADVRDARARSGQG